jgi:hypothetical protein
VRRGEVAEVNGFCAMARELVCGSAADAYGRVCACEDGLGLCCVAVEYCNLPVMMMTLSLTLLPDIVSLMIQSRGERGSILTDSLDLQLQSEFLACLQSYLILELALRALCSGPSGSPSVLLSAWCYNLF